VLARTCYNENPFPSPHNEILFPSPPLKSGARPWTPGVCIFPQHHLKMATLRFPLFIALLLGAALLVAPHHVIATIDPWLCRGALRRCGLEDGACRECVLQCRILERETTVPWLGSVAATWAYECSKDVRN